MKEKGKLKNRVEETWKTTVLTCRESQTPQELPKAPGSMQPCVYCSFFLYSHTE